jgi:hypothetical protein
MIDPTAIPRPLRRAIKPAMYAYRGLTAAMRVLPDFLIIGAQRCGTTYLYNGLAGHPCVAPALTKEVHFFDVWFAKGLRWYRSFFPTYAQRTIWRACGQPLLAGEASPYYLFHPRAPRRAAATLPEARLIALLRNPVDRAYSHYQHSRRRGAEELSFEEAIEREAERLAGEAERIEQDERYVSYSHQNYSYLARGVYVDQIARWLAVFPRERLLVVQAETLYADPLPHFEQAHRFLNLPAWQKKGYQRPRAEGYPRLDARTRERLAAYFEPHNRRLYDVLGVRFDWDK